MFFSNLTVTAAQTDMNHVCVTLSGGNSSTFIVQVLAPEFPVYLGQKFTARIYQDIDEINESPAEGSISVAGVLFDCTSQDNCVNSYTFCRTYGEDDDQGADVIQASFIPSRDTHPFCLGYTYRLEFMPE